VEYTFNKEERLKSKRLIDALFSNGKVIAAYPVKVFWIEAELPVDRPFQFGVSAPKRKFKKAVDRNTIKRKIREIVRLNKHLLAEAPGIKGRQFAFMILYTGADIPEYKILEKKITGAFNRFMEIA
jgi:ribonuclease P protein component